MTRLYEVVFLFHPNQSDRVDEMLARYQKFIEEDHKGQVVRIRDLERKKLHYTIKRCKSSKAHFALMSFSGTLECLQALKENFRFNEVIMRYLIIKRRAVTADVVAGVVLEKDEKCTTGRTHRQILSTDFRAEDVYLNIGFLRDFVLDAGRVVPARVGGLRAAQQRQVRLAIKWARFLGLMPYCDRHS